MDELEQEQAQNVPNLDRYRLDFSTRVGRSAVDVANWWRQQGYHAVVLSERRDGEWLPWHHVWVSDDQRGGDDA